MQDEYHHHHDEPGHRQGEGDDPEGDAAINRQRVGREAEKHRDPAQDPAGKKEAEHRHSAPKDRVLAAEYDGQDEVDPDEHHRRKVAENEAIKAEMDEKQRKQKEAVQQER